MAKFNLKKALMLVAGAEIGKRGADYVKGYIPGGGLIAAGVLVGAGVYIAGKVNSEPLMGIGIGLAQSGIDSGLAAMGIGGFNFVNGMGALQTGNYVNGHRINGMSGGVSNAVPEPTAGAF